LYGEIQMATTTFSGPVVSTNGFQGNISTGTVTPTTFVAPASAGLAAALVDEANALNTTGKVVGKQVTDLDDGLIYTATGTGVNDDWVGSDGTTSITPAA
jgi:hypothetical protein